MTSSPTTLPRKTRMRRSLPRNVRNSLFAVLLLIACQKEAFASDKHQSRPTALPFFRGGSPARKTIDPAFVRKEHLIEDGILTESTKLTHVRAEYVAETKLPTDIGQFRLRAYRVPGQPLGQEPCVIYSTDKPPFGTDGKWNEGVPVRIHDQCLTSEVFRSQRCDCKEQLNMSLRYIQKHGGAVIYLQQEGRGIGLANKVAAYALQDDGMDTVDANLHLGFPEDMREYDVVRDILAEMRIASIQLMTNNPRKVEKMASLGVQVDGTLPMVVPKTNEYNHRYMETKVTRMNHENLASLVAKDPTALMKSAVNSRMAGKRRQLLHHNLYNETITNN